MQKLFEIQSAVAALIEYSEAMLQELFELLSAQLFVAAQTNKAPPQLCFIQFSVFVHIKLIKQTAGLFLEAKLSVRGGVCVCVRV